MLGLILLVLQQHKILCTVLQLEFQFENSQVVKLKCCYRNNPANYGEGHKRRLTSKQVFSIAVSLIIFLLHVLGDGGRSLWMMLAWCSWGFSEERSLITEDQRRL